MGSIDPPANHSIDRMPLRVGMHMQLLTGPSQCSHASALVGYVRDDFVIARLPLAAGVAVPFRIGEIVMVRLMAGVHVFAFEASVERLFLPPIGYLHLTWPTRIHATQFRTAPRVEAGFTATTILPSGEEQTVQLVDLSLGGGLLRGQALGGRDASLRIRFALPESADVPIELDCVVRSHRQAANDDQVGEFGVKWEPADETQRLRLQNFVYEKMLARG